MPRIFKGSESELRLLLSRSQETLTDIKIKLYTTNLEDAIEVIDGIAVEGDTAVISLAPRAFIGMEDGVVNYIVEAKVEGQSYYMERQSNYMLRSLSYINESGVASTTLEITQNGDYRVTPNDGLYVDIDVNVPVPVILDKDTLTLKSGDSGVYTTPQNYDAVKTLEYDVLPPNILGTDKITIKAGEKKTYTAPDEYDGIESLTIEAVPNQDMEVTITDNGEYTYMSDTDYSGIGVFKANVEVPIQEKAEVFNDNGDYTIVPDENYVAMRRINVKVDYKPKQMIPNCICLSGSTWTTFDVTQYDWSRVSDLSYMFYDCPNLTSITGIENFVTSKVGSLYYMLGECRGLTTLDTSNWDTSNIVDINSLFYNCSNLTSINGIENWDVSNVFDMKYTFYNCGALRSLDLSKWDVSNVIYMHMMFYGCSNLTSITGIENWDTSNVVATQSMFYRCSNITSLDLSKWDTSKVTTMQEMFRYCGKLTEVKMGGDVSNVTSVTNMFSNISTTGTFYYNPEYDYSKIIEVLPSTWTAVPMEQ